MKLPFQKGSANPLASLAAVIILVFFGVILSSGPNKLLFQNAIYMNGAWELTRNEEAPQTVNLGEYVFPTIQRGDRFTLRSTLPEAPFECAHMQIRIWHSTVEVLVDGASIFQYGAEALAEGKPVGGGYQWIELPHSAGGKPLEIRLLATEYDSFTQFAPPMLDASDEMLWDFVRQNSSVAAIGLFLATLGVIALLFTAVLLLLRRDSLQLFWIALLSLDIGIWVLCRYGIIQLLSADASLNYYLEYLCLYLTPPLALLCVYAMQDERRKPPLFTSIFMGANLLYVPVLLLLHALNILRLAEALRVCHFFIFIACIFIFVYCFQRRHNAGERIKLLGVTVLTVFSILDLLLFMRDKAVPQGNESIRYSLAAIGAILFILILLINYAVTSMQRFYAQVETEALEKMAYTDSLTGLANRAKANEVLEQMDATPQTPCGELLFDLNHLKETNDLYGHAAGDALIRAFSSILSASFAQLGTVARIGGDEFIVLFSAPDEQRVNEAIADMQKRIDAHNAEETVSPVSTAYGRAYSWELTDWNTEKLYRLADERMYECKAEMKSND